MKSVLIHHETYTTGKQNKCPQVTEGHILKSKASENERPKESVANVLKTVITVVLLFLIISCGRNYKIVNTSYNAPFDWSPDGSKIVVYREVVWGNYEDDEKVDENTYGGSRLCVMNADGTDKKDILTVEDVYNYFLTVAWSPTNEWIAYTTYLNKNYEIHLIKPDGTGHQKLEIIGKIIIFSPDGEKIIYQPRPSIATFKIYDLDTKSETVIITPSDTMAIQARHWDTSDWIYYNYAPGDYTIWWEKQIRKVKLDGTDDTLVLDGFSFDDISKDGSMFLGWKPSGWEKVFDFQGNLILDIPQYVNINSGNARFSPDKTKIIAKDGSYAQLVKFNIDGSNRQLIGKHTIEKVYDDNGEREIQFEAE